MAMKVKTATEKSKSSASRKSNVTSLSEFKYHARNSLSVKGDRRDQALTAATVVDTSTIYLNQPPRIFFDKEFISNQPPPVIGIADIKRLEKTLKQKAANDPDTPSIPSQDMHKGLESWLAAYSFTSQRTKQTEAPFVRFSEKEAHIARQKRVEQRDTHFESLSLPMPEAWRTRRATLGWSGRPPTVEQLAPMVKIVHGQLKAKQRTERRKLVEENIQLSGMRRRISEVIRSIDVSSPLPLAQNQPTNNHCPGLTTLTPVYGVANWFRRKEHSRYEFTYSDYPEKDSPKIPTSYYFRFCARKRQLSFFGHLCNDDDLKLPTQGDEEVFNRFKSSYEVKALVTKLPTQSNPRTIKLKQDHDRWMQVRGAHLGRPLAKQRRKEKFRERASTFNYYKWLKAKACSNRFTPYVPVKSSEVVGGTIGCRYEGMWAFHALSRIVDIRKLVINSLVFDDYWRRYLGWYKSWQDGIITINELKETAESIFVFSNEYQQPLASTGEAKEERSTDTLDLSNKRTLFVNSQGVVTDKLYLVTREEAVERGYASPILMSNRESLIVKDVVLSKEALDSWHSQGYGNVDHFILARGWKKIGALMLPTDPVDDESNKIETIELPPAIGRRLSA